MKTLIIIGLFVFSFYGCSENSSLNSSNISSFQTGIYSGSFNISQAEFFLEGLVTINFNKDTYSQTIVLSSNNTDTLESEGSYETQNDTLYFNKNLENVLILLPAWHLLGKFSVKVDENNLMLRQKDESRDYKIYLTRLKRRSS